MIRESLGLNLACTIELAMYFEEDCDICPVLELQYQKNTSSCFWNLCFSRISPKSLELRKRFYIYLHPGLKSFQMKKIFFKSGHKISWYLQKTLFCHKKSKLLEKFRHYTVVGGAQWDFWAFLSSKQNSVNKYFLRQPNTANLAISASSMSVNKV